MRIALIYTLLLSLLACVGCTDEPSNAEQLKANLETLHITISLHPFGAGHADQADPGGGLRSLFLHSELKPFTPHAMWPDGHPVSANPMISKQSMLAVVESLDRLGVWVGAERYYSEATSNPSPPLPPGKNYQIDNPTSPSCTITAVYMSGDYHAYVVSTLPWDNDTLEALNELRTVVAEPSVSELIKTVERFR